MAAPKPTSNLDRQKLNAPQIGEGIWAVFDTGGACILQIVTSRADVNGLSVGTAATGGGPLITVQGADTNIDLNLAALGTGVVHILSGMLLGGTLEVVGATTLDSTLLVKGAATFQAALTQSGGTAAFDSPTLVVDETNHRVGVGTASPVAKLDVTNGYIRALNGTNTAPAAGQGLELVCTGGTGFLQAFDHGGGVYLPLSVNALTLGLNVTTTGAVTIGGPTTITKSLTQSGGDATFDTPTFVVDETNHRVGIGTATPLCRLEVTNGHARMLDGTNVPPATGLGLELLSTGGTGFAHQFNRSTGLYAQFDVDGSALRLNVNSTAAVTIGGATTVQALLTATSGITLSGGDLTLFAAQVKKGTDTWLLPTGLGSDTLVTLTAVQTLSSKTLGVATKILLGGDATGDLYYNGGSGTLTRIAVGASSTVLVGGSSPGWAQVDRTRVVLTTATGIMTLHDAQTKDAAQIFTAQVTTGPSGTGSHQLVVASSAPSGATFTSSQLGIYGTTVTNLMLREMTDSVEAYWQNNSTGVTFGALTNHLLQLVTNNTVRFTIAAAGGVTCANQFTVTTGGLLISAGGFTLTGAFNWVVTATAPSGVSANLTTPGTGGPASKAVAGWIPLSLNGVAGWTPWFQ